MCLCYNVALELWMGRPHGVSQGDVESESHSVVSDSLRPHGLYSPWNSPGQNTGVGSRSLLQGIFPTQGSNSDLPHCRRILYQLNHQENPRILEWAAQPISRASSRPRNWTRVSWIAGRFFTNWATREALGNVEGRKIPGGVNSKVSRQEHVKCSWGRVRKP